MVRAAIYSSMAVMLSVPTTLGIVLTVIGMVVVVPPHFSKFQIFFKNFPALPLGKIASNFKTMREFHSLKLP